MAEHTAIEWCDATFNPWWGCQKVSPACDHCYAERDAKRFAPGRVLWGVGSERRTFDEKHWQQPLRWAKRAFVACPSCGWRGMHTALRHEGGFHRCPSCGNDEWRPARMRVFCASMADWLDLDAPIGEFVRLLDTIRLTPELDWLLLSKRIGNWRKRAESAWQRAGHAGLDTWLGAWLDGAPPANVWLGATVIDQAEADRDIPKLLATPAAVRFLSIEPMLGEVDVLRWLRSDCWCGSRPGPGGRGGVMCPDCNGTGHQCQRLHWIIAGGESGPHARPSHPEWFAQLRNQCEAAGVPFLFKQWGEWMPEAAMNRAMRMRDCGQFESLLVKLDGRTHWIDADDHTEHDAADLRMVKVGKKAAGRLLDGHTHDGFPEVRRA